MSHGEIPPAVWEEIRNEFALPTLERVRAKLLAETGDPEPVMRQLVRVFIGDGTFCPGYQFGPSRTSEQYPALAVCCSCNGPN